MSDAEQTPPATPKFDFTAFPPDTCFYDRRTGLERRDAPRPEPVAEVVPAAPRERRARKERRRRIDPTTFEKQYTDDELEFMNAMQQYKTRTGKPFPSHGDVLRIAAGLGYRKFYWENEEESSAEDNTCPAILPCIPCTPL